MTPLCPKSLRNVVPDSGKGLELYGTACIGSQCAAWAPESFDDNLRAGFGRCGLAQVSQSFFDPAVKLSKAKP